MTIRCCFPRFQFGNSETIHLKSMLFVKSASKRDKSHSLSWPTVERRWFITLFSTENGQHSKRSLSFRVSDGQCQVNSEGIVVVRKWLRYSAFSNASQASWEWNSFCSMLFNVANELTDLILKHFFFNLNCDCSYASEDISKLNRKATSILQTNSVNKEYKTGRNVLKYWIFRWGTALGLPRNPPDWIAASSPLLARALYGS